MKQSSHQHKIQKTNPTLKRDVLQKSGNRIGFQKLILLIKTAINNIIKGTLSFKLTFIVFFIVFSLSTMIFVASVFYPNIDTMLGASMHTPWGIVSSIFTHTNFMHYALNMAGLLMFVLLFAIVNSTFEPKANKTTEIYFIISCFVFAVISNIIWIFYVPQSSIGASGLVYATQGSLLGFTFVNGVQTLNFKKLRNQSLEVLYIIFLNLAVFLILLVWLFVAPDSFLSLGKGVNPIAHGLSFYLAFVAAFFWFLIHGRKESILK